jgi:hypothetical protein
MIRLMVFFVPFVFLVPQRVFVDNVFFLAQDFRLANINPVPKLAGWNGFVTRSVTFQVTIDTIKSLRTGLPTQSCIRLRYKNALIF